MKEFKIITTEELLKMLDNYKFKQLHIHHTWKPSHSNFNGNNHIALQQGMYNYHVNTNKWQDIGQHVSLTPDGLWVTGRPFNVTPASIKGWNTGAFAVEMIGNFDIGHDKLEGEQKESILRLIKYFLENYRESSVKFHREGPGVKKTCPGTSLDKKILIQEAKSMGKAFNDVDDNRWSAKYIEKAKELGLIEGDGQGNFNPLGPLTREQAAVLMIRLYEKLGGK
ncbi:S-layer homology domain-containing protein [Brassicibacter mesophilus]|uniref:S-layer homology domain-containing protein n=1 Tax=Brassicibacter mesophilus TaxID=745119 RepID=UPI003D1B9862